MDLEPYDGQLVYVLRKNVWRYGKAVHENGKFSHVYDKSIGFSWRDIDDWVDAHCVNTRLDHPGKPVELAT